MIIDHRGRWKIRQTKDLTHAPSKREVDGLHSRFTILALDIFSEAPRLGDRSEGVLEGIKGEIASLMVVLEKLYPKQPEERIEELTMVDIKGDSLSLLLSWKRDITSIFFYAKAKQQREIQDRKGKQ